MMGSDVQISGLSRLKNQIAAITTTKPQRRKIHRKMAREVLKASRKNLRQNRQVDGSAMVKRQSGNKKMFKKLGRQMMITASPNYGEVKFKSGLSASIAAKHQYGHSQTITADSSKKRQGATDYSAPATRDQARSLLSAGFKRPRKDKKGYARASQRWIMENLTVGQAGFILRDLRGREALKQWDIKLPVRKFLGMSKKDRDVLVNSVMADHRREIDSIR